MPTRFQIASLSKQFVGACVLSLVDTKTLGLHEPVGRFLPEAAPHWRSATLHDFLTHTSGMAHWNSAGAPAFDAFSELDADARVDAFLRSERRGLAPWHYSSPGYMVVGRVVERAADQPYADVLAERLLKPLGLTDTTTTAPPDAALGHCDGEAVSWAADRWVGTNDLYSTEPDLEAWTRALHAGPLAARASHPHAALPPDPDWLSGVAYGYGLYVGTAGGRPAVFHEGDVPGFRTVAAWLPAEQRAVAVLADDEHADVLAVLRSRIEDGA